MAEDASTERTDLLLQSSFNAIATGIDAAQAIGVSNSLWKMLAHQLAIAHQDAMQMTNRGLSEVHRTAGDQIEACRSLNTAARLMSAFQEGLLTLNRPRIDGNQTVTVQHVNVERGGQAIVGNVQTGAMHAGGAMENSGNAMRSALAAPRCGAYARTTGKPCGGPAMRNGRSRMQGGKAGRKPAHGRYLRATIESRRRARELLGAMRAPIG